MSELSRVTVLGAGTMGAGIAQVAARAGLETRLFDVEQAALASGMSRIEERLDQAVEKGRLAVGERNAVLGRIGAHMDLGEACTGTDVVIEAVPEKLGLKRGVFSEVAKHVGSGCLLATNTSSIPITRIGEGVPMPGRFLGMHFFNPPPVMELIEIVIGEATSEEAKGLACALAERLGKVPIVVRDSPGFATSRLGVALALEAIRMLEEGVASAADIDKAMRLGYRHPMGPLELTDLIGLDVRLHIANTLAAHLDGDRFVAPGLLRRLVEEGRLGRKSGQGFHRWVQGKPVRSPGDGVGNVMEKKEVEGPGHHG